RDPRARMREPVVPGNSAFPPLSLLDRQITSSRGGSGMSHPDPDMNLKPIVNVVDDDPATRDAMNVLLRSVSLDVVCYDTAEAFLSAWEPNRPSCLVLDLRTPDMSGLELQAALDERGVHLPIIFVTAHGNVPAAVRAMREGAVDFL